MLELERQGFIKKLAAGIYYHPRKTILGEVPPDDKDLMDTYLNGKKFLLMNFSYYNSLGLGLTQVYNHMFVYNTVRSGKVVIAGKTYELLKKSELPKNITKEYLVIDLLNNLAFLAEDPGRTMMALKEALNTGKFNMSILRLYAKRFGLVKTKNIINCMC